MEQITQLNKEKLTYLSKSAKPFLKWAGGKTQLLSQYEELYPKELKNGQIRKYIEPFLGGGAMFFDIVSKYNIQKAYLSDINEELIFAYKVIQKDAFKLLEHLDIFSKKYYKMNENNRKRYFYEIREKYNKERRNIYIYKYSRDWILRAAQIIFLNKTCFNGLYRVNKSGYFNVPFGNYKNPKICDEDNILAVSNTLKIAEIFNVKFEDCEKYVDDESFIYFDPPYRPISQTSSFTSYSKYNFNDEDQIRLGEYFKSLDKKHNIKMMLSNSDPTNINPNDLFFKKLFKQYNIRKVFANRMINCNAEKRGQISELLITNY